MEEKKGNKKAILISAIVILLVVAIVGVGYFTYQYLEENKTTGTEWGDTYYSYLEENSKQQYGYLQFPSELEEGEIQFIQLKEEYTPTMITKYKDVKQNNRETIGIYYIKDDGKVNGYTSFGGENVKELNVVLLYDRETKQYKWYQETIRENGEHSYIDLEKSINLNKVTSVHNAMDDKDFYQSDEYKRLSSEAKVVSFKEEEMPKEETTISKFEQTFIKVKDDDQNKAIAIDSFDDLKETKKIITTAVKNYQAQEEILTEEVKALVQERETKIEEIRMAREEAEKKAKEEEEARKVAEEVAKGLKVGNYTVKYGTYKGIEGAEGETLVIQPEGKASVTANFPGANKTIQMTYQIKQYDFAQDISSHSKKEAIVVSGGGYEYAYLPFQNDKLSDGGTGTYTYVEK